MTNLEENVLYGKFPITIKSFSCLQPHFGELCLGCGPDSLQYTGERFCCRGLRQIVAGILRGGLKALCQMEDDYIGNTLYKFRNLRDRAPMRISFA